MSKLVAVAETSAFARQAEKLLTEDERKTLIDFIADNPLEGDEIPGLGGVRKLRFAIKQKGKSGGSRVIYYYLDDDFPVFMLLIYEKSAKEDLTSDEKKAARKFVDIVKAQRARKKR